MKIDINSLSILVGFTTIVRYAKRVSYAQWSWFDACIVVITFRFRLFCVAHRQNASFLSQKHCSFCHYTSSNVFMLNCFLEYLYKIDDLQDRKRKAEYMPVSSELHSCHAQIQHIHHILRHQRPDVRDPLMFSIAGVLGGLSRELPTLRPW